MSHQDRKSQQEIVVNHQVLREVIAWLLPPALFAGMRVRIRVGANVKLIKKLGYAQYRSIGYFNISPKRKRGNEIHYRFSSLACASG